MGSQRPVDDASRRWLATSFGCCAPNITEAEAREDLEEAAHETTSRGIYEQQPYRVPFPRAEPATARPSTSYSAKSLSTFVTSGWDAASRVTTRASISLWRPKTSESHSQLVISAPSDFRKVDIESVPRRRRAEFRPLELSIYLPNNRLSPLPDFSTLDWNAKLAHLELPRPAMLRSATDSDAAFSTTASTVRRKPIESASFLISPSVPGSPQSDLLYDDAFTQSSMPIFPAQMPTLPSRTHSGTLIRSGTQRSSGALSESLGMSRRKSNHSRGTLSDVDDAIRELNTIVEERRADIHAISDKKGTARDDNESTGDHSPTHVPAIAPSMKMRVRTETLSDIGSALSVPHTSRVLSSPQLPALEGHSRHLSSSSDATADDLDEPMRSPPSRSSTRSRLTNWIRTSLPFSPTSGNGFPPLDLKSPAALPFIADLPPRTPPHFQTSHQNMNVHPLYSCPPITPQRDSFSTVTASPHSSVQSSPSKTTRTIATSVTEVEFDSSGKKSFEAGRSISSALDTDKMLMNVKTLDGAEEWKEIGGLAGRPMHVGVAF
ncbi:MAG: hypothetical protein M1821_008256 [Bathelium mastoideum]|nr:MAG: hypothetical protein M1821_008256 [Bathelium mastoideum]